VLGVFLPFPPLAPFLLDFLLLAEAEALAPSRVWPCKAAETVCMISRIANPAIRCCTQEQTKHSTVQYSTLEYSTVPRPSA